MTANANAATSGAAGADESPIPLWPIQLSREVTRRLDGHPGMTILLWLACMCAQILLLAFCIFYWWPVWQQSWLAIWPASVPAWLIALPFFVLVVLSVLVQVWQGLAAVIGITSLYLVLHANLAIHQAMYPDQVLSLHLAEVGPYIQKHPEMLVSGSLHIITPLATIWVFAVLTVSLCWPSIQAVLHIYNTAQTARDEQQRIAADRALQTQRWQDQLTYQAEKAALERKRWQSDSLHEQQLYLIDEQARHRELAGYRQQLLAPAPDETIVQPAAAGSSELEQLILNH